MHDQPGEHPGARLAGTSTEHGASCAIADAPEHHPGGDVPCDPTATRSASRVATPPNSAATSRPLIKIGVIDGNPSVVWRSAARDSWRSWCMTSSAAVPAGIASPGSHADHAQHFAPSSASATAWRTATMLCSNASTPDSTFPKVTGRCDQTGAPRRRRHRPSLLRIPCPATACVIEGPGGCRPCHRSSPHACR